MTIEHNGVTIHLAEQNSRLGISATVMTAEHVSAELIGHIEVTVWTMDHREGLHYNYCSSELMTRREFRAMLKGRALVDCIAVTA